MKYLYPALNTLTILVWTRTPEGFFIAAIVGLISYAAFGAASNTAMEMALLLVGLSSYVVCDITTVVPTSWQQVGISGLMMYAWVLAQSFLVGNSREEGSPHLISGTTMAAALYLLCGGVQNLPWIVRFALSVALGIAFGYFSYKTRNGSNVMTGVFMPIIVSGTLVVNNLLRITNGPNLNMTPTTTACLITAFLSLVEGYAPASHEEEEKKEE